MPKVKVICLYCGKEFNARLVDRRKYCSINCANEAQKTKVKRICQKCKKKFETSPSQIKFGGGKYCSKECYYEIKRNKIKVFCLECNKMFEVNAYAIKTGNGKYCSRKCLAIWKSKNLIGEKSPGWKGGISFEPYCIKFNKEFKERVRNFFGRHCVECRKTESELGQNLDVHHVNYNKMVCCNNVKPLFVSLCRSCNNKANFDRPFWEDWYTEIINEIYNGQCYLPKPTFKTSRRN